MRIVIVGGVAGGMSCAARARRLDESAEIIVLERGEHVSYANCGLPYYVGGEITDPAKLLVQTPQSLRAALNLDVRTRREVTGIDAQEQAVTVHTPEGAERIGYDALVLAPGAQAARPPIPGLDSPRVRTLRTVEDAVALREQVEAGARRAVVLGAGFIGIEAAEALARQGLDVTVVELADHVLPPLETELAALVTDELRALGIDTRTGIAATGIQQGAEHDVVVLGDGTLLPAELIVLSVGVRPDTAVFAEAGVRCERDAIVVDEHGRTSLPGIWAVGDATVSTDAVTGARRPVALAGPANRAGRLVADDILRPGTARPIPYPVGTAIVRIGSRTAALTGANRAALDAAGSVYRTIHLHPNQHAGYFPGATQLHLILHFREPDGLLLGAQAVGVEGVDKRIDVLATAIRGKMTVHDLEELELAYAPPYSSAKDPVNMAGFVASNILKKDVAVIHGSELKKGLSEDEVLIDLRTKNERKIEGEIEGALHIPVDDLRAALPTLDPKKRYVVFCAIGMRGYLACRILTQHGFTAKNLSGGYELYRLFK